MNDTASSMREILVVGAGIAAHTFVACLLRDPGTAVRVTVIGDEGHGPYDRSALVGMLAGADAAELQLDRSVFRDDRVRLIRDDRVLRIDRSGRTVRTRARRTYSYDTLVLATGSFAARVAVEGSTLPGCFVFRTIEDAESVRAFVDSRSHALGRPLRGAVIGGGLHGVTVADALHGAGVDITVVQYPERLMPEQLDVAAAGMLQGALEERGIAVRTRTRTTRLDPDESGAVAALEFQDGTFQRVDLVVFTVGLRPRDELARNAGIDVAPRGGVIIDDRCRTSDPNIVAIGEVARADGHGIHTVAAVQETAEAAALHVLGGEGRFVGRAVSAHHTLAGMDVAYFGDAVAQGIDAVEVITRRDRPAGVYRKLVLTDDAQTLLGGSLVGDTDAHESLSSLVGLSSRTGLAAQLRTIGSAGGEESAVCAHIAMSHRDLLLAVQAAGARTFSEIGTRFGRELGCEECTLTIAQVLSELVGVRGSPGRHAVHGDDDDGLIRVERDGTLVAIPVAPEGAFTAAHLVAIGQIAALFGLRPQLVGARIELRGASSEQRGLLRKRLSAAGLATAGGSGGGALVHGAVRDRGDDGDSEPPEHTTIAPFGPGQGGKGPFAIRRDDRTREDGALRGLPLRAENPA